MWTVALDLLKSPRIVRVARPHDVALAGPRAPLHVVADGTGWLRAGDVTRFVRGSLDEILFVPAGVVEVRFRSLVGGVSARVDPSPSVQPAPGRVRVPTAHRPALADDVVVARPEVELPPARVPVGHAARVSPSARRAPRVVPPVPTLRRSRVAPRVRVPPAPRSSMEVRDDR